MAGSRVSWLPFTAAGFVPIAAGASSLNFAIKPTRECYLIELSAASAVPGENFANLLRSGGVSSILMTGGKISFAAFTAPATDRRVDMAMIDAVYPALLDLFNDKAAGTMDVTGHYFIVEESTPLPSELQPQGRMHSKEGRLQAAGEGR